jgi:hypothetical protein
MVRQPHDRAVAIILQTAAGFALESFTARARLLLSLFAEQAASKALGAGRAVGGVAMGAVSRASG